MAITNAQQYQQILQKEREEKAFGGLLGLDGRRAYVGGSYRSTDDDNKTDQQKASGTGAKKESGQYQGGSGAPGSAESKGSGGDGGYNKNERQLTSDDYKRGRSNFREQFNDYSGGARIADPDYSTVSQRNNQKYQNRIFNARRNNLISQLKTAGLLTPELLKKYGTEDEDGFVTPINVNDLTVEDLRDAFQTTEAGGKIGTNYDMDRTMKSFDEIPTIQDMVDKGFYKKDGVFDNNSDIYDKDRIPEPFNEIDIANVKGGALPKGVATLANFLGKKMAGPLTSEYLGKQFDELEEIGSLNYKDDTSIKGLMERYEPNRYEREYGDNTGGGGGDQQTDPCLGPNPPAYCNINNTPADPATPSRNLGGLAPRFAGSIFNFDGLADGGRAGAMNGGRMMMMANQEEDTPEGGIMDLESGRQMYFLGKLVKKATRAVKKVAKSPLGKAALMYGLGAMGGSFGAGKGFFSKGMFNIGNMKRGLLGANSLMMNKAGLGSQAAMKGLFGKLGLTSGYGGMMPTLKGGLNLGLGIPFALDALGVGKEEDDDSAYKKYMEDMRLNMDARNRPFDFLPSYITGYGKADGGRIGYQEGGDAEPVAKETMPLIDMDGKEMDLREDGGFVPLGRMERADDVPARLSKNEFVFTADAVRNAGEGDIDKGAEVMYNMMKNLESGGDVSEESQGLDGAREMFKTSQRLEEVI